MDRQRDLQYHTRSALSYYMYSTRCYCRLDAVADTSDSVALHKLLISRHELELSSRVVT